MNKTLISAFSLLALLTFTEMAYPQGMKMSEVIIFSTSPLKKDVKPEVFRDYINTDTSPVIKNTQGISIHLFKADRGDRKGEILLVCSSENLADREKLSHRSPFTQRVITGTNVKPERFSDFLRNPDSYIEYHLIGAEKFKALPAAGILGIHYIKVKPERSAEFEKFVIEKLHPAVGELLPDMQLLYYKAVAGTNNSYDTAKYITIFTIKSIAARDKYWPAGAPETEILKQAFKPLKDLAVELGSYLVEDSYLEPESGGAAAYFESHRWTDFIYQGVIK